ncbi:hypothetical protein EV421DRAFT_396698 [Armillaria borealis]|uniref:Uncharacterized protein n=1 Tax=Armillaria borealis TaxID=47425 RepID=A0AA39JM69_9AGAR|nr:hypothetical protein EV421DRAFT_396698 [Armillaria borealis]
MPSSVAKSRTTHMGSEAGMTRFAHFSWLMKLWKRPEHHMEPRQIGFGSAFYTLSSYLTHSCRPSARPSFSSGTAQIHIIAYPANSNHEPRYSCSVFLAKALISNTTEHSGSPRMIQYFDVDGSVFSTSAEIFIGTSNFSCARTIKQPKAVNLHGSRTQDWLLLLTT